MESCPVRTQKTPENLRSAGNQRMLETHKTVRVEDDSE